MYGPHLYPLNTYESVCSTGMEYLQVTINGRPENVKFVVTLTRRKCHSVDFFQYILSVYCAGIQT